MKKQDSKLLPYYPGDSPLVSDADYDALYDELVRLEKQGWETYGQ